MTGINFDKLSEPFPAVDVSWRIQRKSKDGTKAAVIAYLDSRAVMDRLDQVAGPANWQDSYHAGPAGGLICELRINIDGKWVAKEDGAENTEIEPVKGGLADAFKRAAVKWGIGRYLYSLPATWVPINQYGDFEAP
jgi:hypothetical protein